MAIDVHFAQYLAQILPKSLADEALHALAQPLRDSLRMNSLNASAASFTEFIDQISESTTYIPWWPNAYWWQSKYPAEEFKLGNTVEHMAGALYVQEASSMLPVAALKHVRPNKPKLVLDMCAAPGSKTTQLADWLQNEGLIVANEFSSSRLKTLAASLVRCNVSNTVLSHQDAVVFGAQTPAFFDAVLLDAPCTGEGTQRKDPNALKNWSLPSIMETVGVQKRLIESAFHALKPGGVLIYSTCTLNQYENHQVCQHLLNTFPTEISTLPLNALFEGAEKACTEEGWLWVLPQLFDCEGFFVAAFQKTGSLSKNSTARELTPPAKTTLAELNRIVNDTFGDTLEDCNGVWFEKNDTLLYAPQEALQLPEPFRLNRLGIKVAEKKGKTWRLQHEACALFNQKKEIKLTRMQAVDYLKGRDIENAITFSGQDALLSFNSIKLGLAGSVKNKLKNRLPREFVHDQVF